MSVPWLCHPKAFPFPSRPLARPVLSGRLYFPEGWVSGYDRDQPIVFCSPSL